MDWGIVASVVVGLAIFLVALLAIMISGFMLMVRGMKKKIKAGATPKSPMPTFGNAAAMTALPQPPSTSQNVPKNSAPYCFIEDLL